MEFHQWKDIQGPHLCMFLFLGVTSHNSDSLDVSV